MNTNRRDFLLTSAACAAAAYAAPLRLFARPEFSKKGEPALVCIYLRGGADFLNMIVPYDDRSYHAMRPTIGLRKEDGVVDLDGEWGLHPALKPLAPYWESKQLAPVVAVGSPHSTRSHFDAQDFMERGAPGRKDVRSGWLNRYLTATVGGVGEEFRALALQELLPRSLRGDFPVLAVPEKLDRKRGRDTLDLFEQFYGNSSEDPSAEGTGEMGPREDGAVLVSGRDTIASLRRLQEIVNGPGQQGGDYPSGKFSSRLRTVAQVLQADAGLEVAGLDYNGWDDHANQGGAEGRHATRLADFAAGLAAFCDDLGDRLDRTLVLVMTEFGRTVRENGNRGTDHGHGGGMFLLGGGVKGGTVHGDWKGLGDHALYQGRDLPVSLDFRDVMNDSLRELFQFKAPKEFFPDYRPSKSSLF